MSFLTLFRVALIAMVIPILLAAWSADDARAAELPNSVGEIEINPGGGNSVDGSDGVRLVINESGSGYDDIFFANTTQWCCSQGAPFLNIGGQLFGTAYTTVTNWTRASVLSSAGAVTVDGVGQGGTGSGSVTVRYEADRGGRTYIMDRNVSYTYPNNYVTESYTFVIPSGNTDPVKWYYGGDTAPGSSDTGYGIMLTSPLREVISLNPNSSIQYSLREVAGSKAFDGAVSQHYATARTPVQNGADIGFNVVTSNHDAGLMVQWTLSSTPGTQTARFQQVVDFQAVSLQGAFDTQAIAPGATATLNLTVQNSELSAQSDFNYTFDLPAGSQIDSAATNGCGGTLTANVGDSQFTLSGNTSVAMTTGCVVSVPVLFPTAGVYSIGRDSVSGLTSPVLNRVGTQNLNVVAGYQAGQPLNLSSPTVPVLMNTGVAGAGDGGFWDGTLPIAYDYQWLQCDTAGANCSAIAGATSATYTPVAGDTGFTLRLRVRATNAVISSPNFVEAISNTSSVIGAPQNTALPTISGTASTGNQLTVADGTWTDSPTGYAYKWQRCDANGANCVDIAGATNSTYTAVQADEGNRLRAVVTATNAYGSTEATTAVTSAVTGPTPPANTALPTISGTPQAGATLTATDGTWTGATPITFSYQWQRCDSAGANCVDVTGATSDTYTPGAADIASTIRVVVTADNAAAGTVASTSAVTTVVADYDAPVNSSAPTVSGTAKEGETLTAGPGTWSGAEPITPSYQWQRCDAAGGNCADIPGASNGTYTVAPGDVGSTIRVVVTGTGPSGRTTQASSAVTGVIVVAQEPEVQLSIPGASEESGDREFTIVVRTPTKPSEKPTLRAGCSAVGESIVRCEIVLYADRSQLFTQKGLEVRPRLARQTGRVVIGRAVTTSDGAEVLNTTVSLNTLGQRMLRNRAGGIDAEALIRAQIGGGAVVESTSQGRLNLPRQLLAPTDGLFAFNSARMTRRGRAFIRTLKQTLPARPKRILCVGHTDSIGTAATNLTLGRKRARTLCAQLRRAGIRAKKAGVASRGESRPRATNKTAAGRSLNRRVEIFIRY